jgi:hypothetical protein
MPPRELPSFLELPVVAREADVHRFYCDPAVAELADCVVVVDETRLPAHSHLLALGSTVLRDLFRSTPVRSTASPCDLSTFFEGATLPAALALLRMLYAPNASPAQTHLAAFWAAAAANKVCVLGALSLAHMLDAGGVLEEAERWLGETIGDKTRASLADAVAWSAHAATLNMDILWAVCVQRLVAHLTSFERISQASYCAVAQLRGCTPETLEAVLALALDSHHRCSRPNDIERPITLEDILAWRNNAARVLAAEPFVARVKRVHRLSRIRPQQFEFDVGGGGRVRLSVRRRDNRLAQAMVRVLTPFEGDSRVDLEVIDAHSLDVASSSPTAATQAEEADAWFDLEDGACPNFLELNADERGDAWIRLSFAAPGALWWTTLMGVTDEVIDCVRALTGKRSDWYPPLPIRRAIVSGLDEAGVPGRGVDEAAAQAAVDAVADRVVALMPGGGGGGQG